MKPFVENEVVGISSQISLITSTTGKKISGQTKQHPSQLSQRVLMQTRLLDSKPQMKVFQPRLLFNPSGGLTNKRPH